MKGRAQVGATAVAAIGTLGLATAGAAGAAEKPARIDYRDAFTTKRPGQPAGRVYSTLLSDFSDPHGKAPAVAHIHTQLPAGARYDTTAVPACTASDGELMLVGAAACPAGSRVGKNRFVIDTGGPEPNRYMHEDMTYLNEDGGIILLTRDRLTGANLVFHATVRGRSADVDVPLLPGTPPDGGTPRSEGAVIFKATGAAGRSFVTTPPTCPASGVWRFRFVYTFRDGRKQTVTSDQKCLRKAGGRVRGG